MKEEIVYIEDGAEVAPPAWIQAEKDSRYGSVFGIPEEELISPSELERAYLRDELGPILRLPVRGRKSSIKPSMDEDGRIDWGAFGTVDFETTYKPDIDKYQYKADMLKDEYHRVFCMVHMLKERIPGNVKYKLVALVRDGIIEADDINDWDTWQLAKQFMRCLNIKKQIKELENKSRQQRQKDSEKFWRWFLDGRPAEEKQRFFGRDY